MNLSLKTGGYVLSLALAGYVGWYAGTNHKPATAKPTGEVIATINGVSYGKEWFIEQMKLRGGNKPGQYQDTKQKQALLEFLINQEVLYLQAKAQGLDQEPAIDRMYKKAVVDKYLEDNLNKKVAAAKVNEDEVRKHFDANQFTYNKPARRRAAMIFMAKNSSDTAEDLAAKRTSMQAVVDQVSSLDGDTLHFGELARVHSDDKSSKYQGGVIGWLIQHPSRKYKWDDEILEALFALENVGDVTPIIDAEKGFYVLRLVAAESVKEKTFEQVKAGIKNQLLQAKRKKIRNDFMLATQAQAEIEIDMKMLASIPAFSTPKKQPLKPPALPGGNGGL